MKHYVVYGMAFKQPTVVFVGGTGEEVHQYMMEKGLNKLQVSVYDGEKHHYENFALGDTIYVLVFDTHNGEEYEDYSAESVNIYVGTDKEKALSMLDCKYHGAYEYIERKELQYWVNGICIKNETLYQD